MLCIRVSLCIRPMGACLFQEVIVQNPQICVGPCDCSEGKVVSGVWGLSLWSHRAQGPAGDRPVPGLGLSPGFYHLFSCSGIMHKS